MGYYIFLFNIAVGVGFCAPVHAHVLCLLHDGAGDIAVVDILPGTRLLPLQTHMQPPQQPREFNVRNIVGNQM